MEFTEEEINNAKKILLNIEKAELYKQFLSDTDFKFIDDYDEKDTDDWLEIKQKRKIARDFLRSN